MFTTASQSNRAGHLDAAEHTGHGGDAFVVGRHDDLAQRLRELATLDDVLDERLAGD
jgi:hypothetical protein